MQTLLCEIDTNLVGQARGVLHINNSVAHLVQSNQFRERLTDGAEVVRKQAFVKLVDSLCVVAQDDQHFFSGRLYVLGMLLVLPDCNRCCGNKSHEAGDENDL